MSKRLSIVIGDGDYAHLQDLAAAQEVSISALVRDVLRVGVWYEREVKAYPERKLLILRPGEELRELTLLTWG